MGGYEVAFYKNLTVHVKQQASIDIRNEIKILSLWEQSTGTIETPSQTPIICSLNEQRSTSHHIRHRIHPHRYISALNSCSINIDGPPATYQ